MASLAVRKQYMTAVWAEAFVNMMWEQNYQSKSRNTTFAGMRHRLLKQCDETMAVLKKEPAGELSLHESKNLMAVVDRLKEVAFNNGFDPMMAISFIIDQIVEQLAHIKPGPKRMAFDGLLTRIREFERYFDRDKSYDDPEGLEASEKFREMEV